MAGLLPKEPSNFHKIPSKKVAIVCSMWHKEYVSKMANRAYQELLLCGVKEENIQIHNIPGSLELPLAANILFDTQSELDAIIAFGIVMQGETLHNESVLESVVHGFSAITLKHNKPIINEVIGVKSLKEAEARSKEDDNNKGLEAVFALSEILNWKDSVLKNQKK